MFEKLSIEDRANLAKEKMKRVIDHFLYLVELQEQNRIIVYSDTLSSQIPKSYAANAFNVFQRAMHQIEIIRLCALWDGPDEEKENIPTVVELIDSPEVIVRLVEETRRHWADSGIRSINPSTDPELQEIEQRSIRASKNRFADQQASKARSGLTQTIFETRKILQSAQLVSAMNLRDKHLAHSLTSTRREKSGPIAPMKYGDETDLFNASISVVESLYCWVNGISFSIENSQRIDRQYAEALWTSCSFKVLQ
jgi:hypothetical protein